MPLSKNTQIILHSTKWIHNVSFWQIQLQLVLLLFNCDLVRHQLFVETERGWIYSQLCFEIPTETVWSNWRRPTTCLETYKKKKKSIKKGNQRTSSLKMAAAWHPLDHCKHVESLTASYLWALTFTSYRNKDGECCVKKRYKQSVLKSERLQVIWKEFYKHMPSFVIKQKFLQDQVRDKQC